MMRTLLRTAHLIVTGALYGMLVGSTVFYGGLGILAGDLLAAPEWRLLLLGNGVAGVIMVAHLAGKSGDLGAD